MSETGPRVLIVSHHEPWPLHHGGRLRLYHFMRELTARGASVTLALPAPAAHTDHYPPGVQCVTWADVACTTADCDFLTRCFERHFGAHRRRDHWLRMNATRARFDVALLSGATMGLAARHVSVPVVWDVVDELVLTTLRTAEVEPWHRRPSIWKRGALYAAFEWRCAAHVAAAVFSATTDASYARRWLGAGAQAVAISNGVDFDYFAPQPDSAESETVLFFGALDFLPNVDAVRFFTAEVWPQLKRAHPGLRFQIVGRDPVSAVKALGRVAGVEVVGAVPDVRPYIAGSRVVVVPTRLGAGVKNKILEACALERPVVASSRALAGLTVRRGVDVWQADTPARWTATVSALVRDPNRRDLLGKAGRRWVRTAHAWADAGRRMTDLLAEVSGTSFDAMPVGSVVGSRFRASSPDAGHQAHVRPPAERADVGQFVEGEVTGCR